ncbi:MAG TPA: helix-turn-helix domain-containing protein [Candidatus Nitrosotalea sp.]|nr:helix-turn-helix domain-containing protein [Candidatus Nitrosotalea sp.]
MTNDDVLYRSRLRLFALVREMGSVRAACRLMGVHHSTYYRWHRQLVRYGTEILRPRERRQPRMPNAISPMFEQRILALALAYPGWGPDRLSLELGRPKWGGLKVSANGVWRVLKRHGLSTRAKRLGLVAGYAAPPEPEPRPPLPELHIKADRPGHRVQMDCFYIGRLSGTQGVVWQYGHRRGLLLHLGGTHLTPKNPSAKWTSELARKVAEDLSNRGWKLEAVTTDNASEFRSKEFNSVLAELDAKHIYIRPGRPTSNGCVERVQQTLLHECWKPAFARYLTPKYTGLRRDLERELVVYNTDRAHQGRRTKELTPEQTLMTRTLWS